MNADMAQYGVSPGVLAGIAVFAIAMLVWLVRLVVRAQHLRRVNGDAVLVGQRTVLLEPLSANSETWVVVDGEYWRVCSVAALPAGARVRVMRRNGLVLWVEPL